MNETDVDVRADFDRAVEEFGRRVRATPPAGDAMWSRPTPCAEWDVRDLVGHLVGELRWMPPLLEGRTIAEVGGALDGDLLGADPHAAWDGAVTEVDAALSAPGVLDRTVHLSYGDRPAADYVAEVTSDLTVHSWDLARGIGADDRIDPHLVERAHARVAPMAKEIGESGMFGTPVDVGDDADLQTRLLAVVGRDAGAR